MSRVWRLFLCKRGVVVIWTWLTWERWSGLVNVRTADSLTPSLPGRSTWEMHWVLMAEYRAILAVSPAGGMESAVHVCEVAGTPRYEDGLGIANWRDGFCCAPPRPQRGTSPSRSLRPRYIFLELPQTTVTSTWSLRPTALSGLCAWLTWVRWPEHAPHQGRRVRRSYVVRRSGGRLEMERG